LPFGPYHLALEEPVLIKLYVEGERVVGADVRMGYVHRGIEYLMERKPYDECLRLAERVCAICTQAHSQCFAQTVEEIAGVRVPERADYIRVLIAELNRVESHLLLLGLAAHLMGFDTLFMHIWALRERVMQALEELTGNRVQYAITRLGGVRRDVNEKLARAVRNAASEVRKGLERFSKVLEGDATVLARTRGVGTLSKEDAVRLGVVGPVLRASGVEWDVRRSDPYSVYDELEFDVVVRDEGDAWARFMVRYQETLESLRIIEQVLDRMPPGEIYVEVGAVPRGEATTRVEAPRGELLYYVKSTGAPTPYRVRIRTPTIPNIGAAPVLLEEARVADVPVIVGSLDPCISCANRVIKLKR